MPCLEESPKPLQLEPVTDNESQQPGGQEESQPTRELTQTDELNKRLLKSFLDRLNESDFVSKFNSAPEDSQPVNEFDD